MSNVPFAPGSAGTDVTSQDEVIRPGYTFAPGENHYFFAAIDGWGTSLNLTFQTDGNLVLYDLIAEGKALWSTHTDGNEDGGDPGVRCEFQLDGNLVVYDGADKALWSSNHPWVPRDNAELHLQRDGNVVIYDPYPSGVVFATNTTATREPPPH